MESTHGWDKRDGRLPRTKAVESAAQHGDSANNHGALGHLVFTICWGRSGTKQQERATVEFVKVASDTPSTTIQSATSNRADKIFVKIVALITDRAFGVGIHHESRLRTI
jgi:hypothetical protein